MPLAPTASTASLSAKGNAATVPRCAAGVPCSATSWAFSIDAVAWPLNLAGSARITTRVSARAVPPVPDPPRDRSRSAVIDRQSPVGRRDYAMVLLLASYGLRGIEVVRLRLDDIDWRSQLLHIRQRKVGNSGTYPLSLPVGKPSSLT